jgi:hypothetical protein
MTGDIVVGAVGQGRDLLDWATPIFTLLGVIVVAFYTAYARKQNKLTEKALIYTKRAWLIPRIRLIEATPNRSVWKLSVAIANTGESPGTIIAIGADLLALDPIGNPRDIPVPRIEERSAIVAQGSSDPYVFNVPDLSAEEENFRTGAKVLFATCLIEYTDVFKQKWRTKAAWHRPKDNGWVATPGYSEMV